MNQDTPFVISQFTNPSGEIVFRVSGWLDGKRIRKNIATRPEAEAERQVLEVQRLQGETGIRTAVTRLVEDQLHEAESVFRRLDGRTHSLSFYVEFALANYREPPNSRPPHRDYGAGSRNQSSQATRQRRASWRSRAARIHNIVLRPSC